MSGDRGPGGESVTMGDSSRMPAAFAAALVLHALLFALVAARPPVRLAILPAPLLLTFIEPAVRNAGPGRPSPVLRSAAPAPPMQPREPDPVEAPRAASPGPLPATPKRPEATEPKEAVAKKPKEAGTKKALAAAAHEAAALAADATAASASRAQAAAASAGGMGADARSSAPQWAPSARIRYEALLYAWIDRHKHYPLLARRRGIEGNGSVRVRIDRDGRVLNRSLERSTGQGLLDEAALDMVRRADPFPKAPPEYAGTSFEFVAPVEYRLR